MHRSLTLQLLDTSTPRHFDTSTLRHLEWMRYSKSESKATTQRLRGLLLRSLLFLCLLSLVRACSSSICSLLLTSRPLGHLLLLLALLACSDPDLPLGRSLAHSSFMAWLLRSSLSLRRCIDRILWHAISHLDTCCQSLECMYDALVDTLVRQETQQTCRQLENARTRQASKKQHDNEPTSQLATTITTTTTLITYNCNRQADRQCDVAPLCTNESFECMLSTRS